MTASHDNWDDLMYLKPQDCDDLGYCVHCRTATVHRTWCVVLEGARYRSSGEQP